MGNIKSNRVFLLTDTHFFYEKLKHPKEDSLQVLRPEDFQKKILENIKKTIKPGDTVIHLGDIANGVEKDSIKKMIKASGTDRWILIKGEKDTRLDSWYLHEGFMLVTRELVVFAKGIYILLTHEPYYGSSCRKDEVRYNIHGHTHGRARKDAVITPDYDLDWHLEYSLERMDYAPVELHYAVVRLLPKKRKVSKMEMELEKEKEKAREEGEDILI